MPEFKTDHLPPPEGYELIYIGTVKEGDLFWANASENWQLTKARIDEPVSTFMYPTARAIDRSKYDRYSDWGEW